MNTSATAGVLLVATRSMDYEVWLATLTAADAVPAPVHVVTSAGLMKTASMKAKNRSMMTSSTNVDVNDNRGAPLPNSQLQALKSSR